MSMTRTWTEAELMVLPEDGFKRELVDGEILLSPAGFLHGRVIIALALKVGAFVQAGNLGSLADSSTDVWMPSGNLRADRHHLLIRLAQRATRCCGRHDFGRVAGSSRPLDWLDSPTAGGRQAGGPPAPPLGRVAR